jgi:hypothetical protein
LEPPVLLAAPEDDAGCVPPSEEQPIITTAEAIKVARRAVEVLGKVRASMLVSIGWVG